MSVEEARKFITTEQWEQDRGWPKGSYTDSTNEAWRAARNTDHESFFSAIDRLILEVQAEMPCLRSGVLLPTPGMRALMGAERLALSLLYRPHEAQGIQGAGMSVDMFRAFIAGCLFGIGWTLMAERMALPAFGMFALLGAGAVLMAVITALLSWESA